MRRNCVECRHWSVGFHQGYNGPTGQKVVMVCAHDHYGAGPVLVWPHQEPAIRLGLRTATDCGDYEAVEPEMADCTCRLGATSGRVPDPRCPLHGAKPAAGPAEIDLELL